MVTMASAAHTASAATAAAAASPERRRVKVYELKNNDWFDRGTGFCTATHHEVGRARSVATPLTPPGRVAHPGPVRGGPRPHAARDQGDARRWLPEAAGHAHRVDRPERHRHGP